MTKVFTYSVDKGEAASKSQFWSDHFQAVSSCLKQIFKVIKKVCKETGFSFILAGKKSVCKNEEVAKNV